MSPRHNGHSSKDKADTRRRNRSRRTDRQYDPEPRRGKKEHDGHE